jgi:hypothetical protein
MSFPGEIRRDVGFRPNLMPLLLLLDATRRVLAGCSLFELIGREFVPIDFLDCFQLIELRLAF